MTAATLEERARDELRRYAIVAGYLYVCLAALMLYKSALLETYHAARRGAMARGTARAHAGRRPLTPPASGARDARR